MAPNILRAFLQIDPELIEIRNEKQNNELSIHRCIRDGGENPNMLEFLKILLLIRSHQDLVNIPSSEGLLPIHLAASRCTVEVFQMLYEYSPSSINVIIPGRGSVAHIAASKQKLDILKYIHTINPELILIADNDGFTLFSWTVARQDRDCDFIKAVYALGPTAISEVQFY